MSLPTGRVFAGRAALVAALVAILMPLGLTAGRLLTRGAAFFFILLAGRHVRGAGFPVLLAGGHILLPVGVFILLTGRAEELDRPRLRDELLALVLSKECGSLQLLVAVFKCLAAVRSAECLSQASRSAGTRAGEPHFLETACGADVPPAKCHGISARWA